MSHKIFIGIDAGKKTGFAVWNSTQKRFELLQTLLFWDAVAKLGQACKHHLAKKNQLFIVIEDVTQNNPTFGALKTYQSTVGDHAKKIAAVCEQAKRVGTVWDKTYLLIEWCERNKLNLIKVKPGRNTKSKLKADAFKSLTGYQEQTNEHSRDAGMLVYGR